MESSRKSFVALLVHSDQSPDDCRLFAVFKHRVSLDPVLRPAIGAAEHLGETLGSNSSFSGWQLHGLVDS